MKCGFHWSNSCIQFINITLSQKNLDAPWRTTVTFSN
jgi:hypothetical protein